MAQNPPRRDAMLDGQVIGLTSDFIKGSFHPSQDSHLLKPPECHL